MNLQDIITEVERDLDTAVPSEKIIGWANRALDDLTPIAKLQSKKTLIHSTDNNYILPEDLFEIAHLTVDGIPHDEVTMKDVNSRGYKVWGNILSLNPNNSDSLIELYYYKKLNHLNNFSDIPEIPSQFHDLIVLYVIGHELFSDEEFESQEDALRRYNQRKSEFEMYTMKKEDINYQIIDVYRF
ncbi:hypothetical protein [Metabacillus sp. cB07]|uniref:phage adaptor protein n=1 Tax=Metabacillus sp. cB07 TaxID=2806989 RepID=UPI001939F954|nr:hypothetical protein [Metabacillus sp. cB07]